MTGRRMMFAGAALLVLVIAVPWVERRATALPTTMPPPSPAASVTATAICKCVGDAACGGGKIYRHDISVPTCQHGVVQRVADDYCNNDDAMKRNCLRPRCYYRHTDYECPKK